MKIATPRPFTQSSMLLAWMIFLAGSMHAERIDWGTESGGINLDSNGAPMDAGFQFQLGVFNGGFVPTIGNLAAWDAHWVPAQTAFYETATNRVNDEFIVEDNDPPFVVGAQAWIYGRKVTPTGTEVILLRRPSWTWPEPTFLNAQPPIWRVNGNANINVVIGSVSPGGSPFLMQTEVVRDYAQWRELTLAGEPLNGPSDDPDGDGIPNLLEFAFDTNPLVPGAPVVTEVSEVEVGGEFFLEMTVPRRRTHLANLTVQVSSDLVQWDEGPAFTEVVIDDPFTWVVRDKTPRSIANDKRFIRLKAQ